MPEINPNNTMNTAMNTVVVVLKNDFRFSVVFINSLKVFSAKNESIMAKEKAIETRIIDSNTY